jgi:hypothetical protein
VGHKDPWGNVLNRRIREAGKKWERRLAFSSAFLILLKGELTRQSGEGKPLNNTIVIVIVQFF